MKQPSIKISPFLLAKLEVRPGDWVVVQTDMLLDKDQVAALRKNVDLNLKPLKVKSIILTAGMKLGVLRRRGRP